MINLTQTPGAVNSAPVNFPTTDPATVAQMFAIAEKVNPHYRVENSFQREWAPRCKGSAWLLYTELLICKGSGDIASVSRKTLAENTGLYIETVDAAIAKLVELKMITASAAYWDNTGFQRHNDYHFLVLPYQPISRASRKNPQAGSGENPIGASGKNPQANNKKQRVLNTKQQDSARAEIADALVAVAPVADAVVKNEFSQLLNDNLNEVSDDDTVSPASAAILDELSALGALNAVTRRLALANPRKAECQIERLRAAMGKGRGVPNPGGWFNTAMIKNFSDAPRSPGAAATAQGVPAPRPDDEVGNGDVRREWAAKPVAAALSADERRERALAHVERCLSSMTPSLRAGYEHEMQGFDLGKRVAHLKLLAYREWSDAQYAN